MKFGFKKKISRLLCVEWSRSHAFLSQSCPLMGSLALAWVAYLCAPQCLLLRCRWVRLIGSCSWSLFVDQLSLFELVLPWSPDFLKHLIWPSVFDWLCVSFRGWTFLQFCQPFGRGRPKNTFETLGHWRSTTRWKASNEAIRNPTFAFFLRSLDAWHLDLRFIVDLNKFCNESPMNIQVFQKILLLSFLVSWWDWGRWRQRDHLRRVSPRTFGGSRDVVAGVLLDGFGWLRLKCCFDTKLALRSAVLLYHPGSKGWSRWKRLLAGRSLGSNWKFLNFSISWKRVFKVTMRDIYVVNSVSNLGLSGSPQAWTAKVGDKPLHLCDEFRSKPRCQVGTIGLGRVRVSLVDSQGTLVESCWIYCNYRLQ